MASDPLAQFEIKPLIAFPNEHLAFSNSSLWMVIAVVSASMFLYFAVSKKNIVPTRFQSCVEMLYEFIASMVKENIGNEGMKYFPLVFSLFMFVIFCNLAGMLPYSFTVTSHIIVTFALAMMIFVVVNIIGFTRHGMHYFSMFLPKGTPLWLAPLIVVIEIFSYLSRPISLSIRLAANMMAGHVLLKVVAGFVAMMGLLGVFPLMFVVAITAFEIFVAVLQAYIFTILTCVYLNDAVNLH